MAQTVRNLPVMWETWVWSLGWEDPLDEGMQLAPVFLPGESPWIEEPGGLQSMGSQRVRHDWVTKHSILILYSSSIIQSYNSVVLNNISLISQTEPPLPPMSDDIELFLPYNSNLKSWLLTFFSKSHKTILKLPLDLLTHSLTVVYRDPALCQPLHYALRGYILN